MKKFSYFFKFSAIALIVAMMATVVVSCGSKDDDEPPAAATLSVTPSGTSITLSAEGQTTSFTVETNRATWNVSSSDPSWLTATKSGTSFTLTATANNTSSDRTATVTVTAAGATSVTITVQQPNIPVAEPTLSITPSVTSIQFSATGAVATSDGNTITPTFTVETNQSTWEVSSSAPAWLTATKSETGFTLTATANTSSDRTATVTVSAGTASVTINVQQKLLVYEDITAAKLTNYAMPFKHKDAVIINLDDNRWHYDVDGGWLYNPVGGANGVVFANIDETYPSTLTLTTWEDPRFHSQNIVNGKLYQTVELEAGSYKFTVNPHAITPYGTYDVYVVAAAGDIPDVGAVSGALASKQVPADNYPYDAAEIPSFAVEFTLSQTTTVSLGLVANINSGEFHIRSVQLMRAQ